MLNIDVITEVETVYTDPRMSGKWYPPGSMIRYLSGATREILVQRTDTIGDMVPSEAALTQYPTANFSASTSNASEDSGTATITVQLSSPAPTGGASIAFACTGDAELTTDYTITATPLVIAAGEIDGTMTVTLVNRAGTQGARDLVVTMGAATRCIAGRVTVHTMTIPDAGA
jgi:hypothetical protein